MSIKRIFLAALVLGCLASCSQTLSPTPPDTVTDPAMIQLYQKAIAGDIEALGLIGNAYYTGSNGFPKDDRACTNAFETAAKRGSALGCRLTGIHYEKGIGRLASDSTARDYYQQAIRLGDHEASRLLQELEARLAREEAERQERVRNYWNNAANEYNRVTGGYSVYTAPTM